MALPKDPRVKPERDRCPGDKSDLGEVRTSVLGHSTRGQALHVSKPPSVLRGAYVVDYLIPFPD